MTKDQAINLIDQVCARFQGTRQDHEALIEAIQTIKGLSELEKIEQEEKKEE